MPVCLMCGLCTVCVQTGNDARGGATFHPIIDKQGMVHGEGPALTHLDLHMPTATCQFYTIFTHDST